MQVVLVISGITCSGKTTLANKVKRFLHNSVVMSFDNWKELEYNSKGFATIKERDLLDKTAREKFELDVRNNIDNNWNVILEYPFRDSKWGDWFNNLIDEYPDVKFISIEVIGDVNKIFERYVYRNANDKSRHPGHYSRKYKDGKFIKKPNLSLHAFTMEYDNTKWISLDEHYIWDSNTEKIRRVW